MKPAATPTSPKVILMTAAALIAPAILAGLQYLQTDQGRTLFATLPPVLVVVVGALVSGLVTFVAGFLKSDPLRNGAGSLSPKVLLAALVTVVVTAVLAGLQYLQTPDGQTLFHALPPVLIVTIGALISSASTFLAGYFKIDPNRTYATPEVINDSDGLQPEPVGLVVDEGPDPDDDPPVAA